MLDPISPPSTYLFQLIKPWADKFHVPTLPYHIHEVLFALVLYQSVQSIISPLLSNFLFPSIYKNLTPRTRINWDVHVVSLVQSCLINTLALWVMYTDTERRDMSDSVVERIYGYTGASGLVQGLACGYFLWDLIVSTRYLRIFGIGIWAHASTALCVYSFGFRPFANYYGPPFILYELSSPFLNIHWFCDKLHLTGSKLQWYNGMLLLFTFFCCRLLWGTYQSFCVYADVYQILHLDIPQVLREGHVLNTHTTDNNTKINNVFSVRDGQLCLGNPTCIASRAEVTRFITPSSHIPLWLIAIYVVSNMTLNALNWYWFGKMIQTVRKRFEGKETDEHGDQDYENKRGEYKRSERDSNGNVNMKGMSRGNGKNGYEDENKAVQEYRERERRKSVVEYAADSLDRGVLTGPVTPGAEGEVSEKAAMMMSSNTSSSGAQVDGGVQVGRRRKDL